MQIGELLLTLIALFTGGAVPVFQLIGAATYTMSKRPQDGMQRIGYLHYWTSRYVRYFEIPALVVLLGVFLISLVTYSGLANRVWGGVLAGILASVGLDAVRLSGVKLGWMPFDMPPIFGLHILGPNASQAQTLTAGYLYHFLNGAGFGLVYTLVGGAPAWWWGLIWGLLVELGMMTTPPMLVMGVGAFGLKRGYGIFTVSLIAHVVFGILLGVLTPLFVWSNVPIWQLLGL